MYSGRWKCRYFGLCNWTPRYVLFKNLLFLSILFNIATTHIAAHNFVYIYNSVVVGAITPNDCSDIVDPTTVNALYSQTAIPTVSATSFNGNAGGRSGIVFPFIIGGNNMIPYHAWTSIGAYPCGKPKIPLHLFPSYN